MISGNIVFVIDVSCVDNGSKLYTFPFTIWSKFSLFFRTVRDLYHFYKIYVFFKIIFFYKKYLTSQLYHF